jgi:hypothetical protein
MITLQTALLGLISPDPIKFDNSYDSLLLDDDTLLNNNLMDSIDSNQNAPETSKILLQILCFRATQVKNKIRWSHRLNGTLTFARYLHLLLDSAEDVNPELRTEAIHCLGDLFENNMDSEMLQELLNENPQSIYPLRYPQAVRATLDTLENITNSDMDVNVQLLAASTLKKINREYSGFNRTQFVDNHHYACLER